MCTRHTFQKSRSLLLAAFLALAGCGQRNPSPVATPPLVVLTATSVEREVVDYDIFTARTQATQSVEVRPRVTGYLTEICFKDGDDVKRDQVLFKIDDRPYKASLDVAKANLEVCQATLVKTQADYDIGLRVRKEQVGAISEQEINRRLGARDESKGGVDQAKAALEQAQLYYDWCKVLAPIDGRADRHFVDIGNLITQDVTALTNIVSLKPTWAYFDIDENTVRKYQRLVAKGDIKTPRATEVPVQMALGDDPDFPLEGYIDFLGNQLDPNTGSIRARAVFPNKEGTLAAGMFGRIRVPSNEPHKALLVLDSAIGTDQGQKFVYVVNVQNQVEYRPVDVGQMHGTLREVNRYRTVVEAVPDGQDERRRVEVLLPADRVIVEGVQRVRPGATVDPKLVDMTTLLAQPVEAAAAPSASGSASKPRAAEK